MIHTRACAFDNNHDAFIGVTFMTERSIAEVFAYAEVLKTKKRGLELLKEELHRFVDHSFEYSIIDHGAKN